MASIGVDPEGQRQLLSKKGLLEARRINLGNAGLVTEDGLSARRFSAAVTTSCRQDRKRQSMGVSRTAIRCLVVNWRRCGEWFGHAGRPGSGPALDTPPTVQKTLPLGRSDAGARAENSS